MKQKEKTKNKKMFSKLIAMGIGALFLIKNIRRAKKEIKDWEDNKDNK